MSASRRRRRGRVETIEQTMRWRLSWRREWLRAWRRWEDARDRRDRTMQLARVSS